jgi:hypothetical protein
MPIVWPKRGAGARGVGMCGHGSGYKLSTIDAIWISFEEAQPGSYTTPSLSLGRNSLLELVTRVQ